MNSGRVGEILRRYDEGQGAIRAIADYLETIDSTISDLQPGDSQRMRAILDEMRGFQQDLRLSTHCRWSGPIPARRLWSATRSSRAPGRPR